MLIAGRHRDRDQFLHFPSLHGSFGSIALIGLNIPTA
jgi:hypothetical protein